MTFFELKMKCHFLQLCAVFLFMLLQKYFFCFLPYSHQRQMNSFRISGVHGILSSQIIPLQYTTLVTGCQVEFVLILFYYFLQHFITIFCATTYSYMFARFTSLYIIGRNSPQKCNLDVQNPLSYKAFCGHFSCALLHAEHNLTQLYHTIHLTACQVKIM